MPRYVSTKNPTDVIRIARRARELLGDGTPLARVAQALSQENGSHWTPETIRNWVWLLDHGSRDLQRLLSEGVLDAGAAVYISHGSPAVQQRTTARVLALAATALKDVRGRAWLDPPDSRLGDAARQSNGVAKV